MTDAGIVILNWVSCAVAAVVSILTIMLANSTRRLTERAEARLDRVEAAQAQHRAKP